MQMKSCVSGSPSPPQLHRSIVHIAQLLNITFFFGSFLHQFFRTVFQLFHRSYVGFFFQLTTFFPVCVTFINIVAFSFHLITFVCLPLQLEFMAHEKKDCKKSKKEGRKGPTFVLPCLGVSFKCKYGSTILLVSREFQGKVRNEILSQCQLQNKL